MSKRRLTIKRLVDVRSDKPGTPTTELLEEAIPMCLQDRLAVYFVDFITTNPKTVQELLDSSLPLH